MSSPLIDQAMTPAPAGGPAADPAVDPSAAAGAPAGVCPVPHGLTKLAPEGVCPFPHDAASPAARAEIQRSAPDRFMRALLRIKERPEGVTSAQAYRSFQKSMLISATRCTLTYVVFPFVLPALKVGFNDGIGPVIGIVIGLIALVSDVFTVRRFFAIDHKWRWYFTAAAVSVMTLLTILLVEDINHLLS